MLIPPDMRLHLTKHKIQALSPHVRSSRCGCLDLADKFCTKLVPATGEVAPYLVLSLGEADIRQLPYPYARSERRSYFMEGRQGTRRLGYVSIHRPRNSPVKEFFGVLNRSLAVLYTMSKKLAQILSLPLVLHNISAPRLRGLKQNDPKFHKSDNVPPEVVLISTVIVVIRLVYGLDGRTRYAPCDDP